MEGCKIVQKAVIKTIPKKKKCQKAKWFSEKVLQIAEKRIEVKCQSRFEAQYWMLGAGLDHCLLYDVTNLHP